MITAIREVRRARGLTLEDVARRCDPPTTAQTIGRLETGTRTVSVAWLNRIARALEVEAADLVRLPERPDLPVAALVDGDGAWAPQRPEHVVPPALQPGLIAVRVTGSVGDYRAGDEVWCERLAPERFGRAINRDVLVPRPAGRFAFGRLIDREEARLHLLPPGSGARQQVIADPPWIGLAIRLVRAL
ncbi:helix-turn-helix transcriptional regulator [Sphingomonas sp.]|uniref:helix-turn-helix domain-containing protein n=1 Tax=Sphingomonas sp. TaxID=28214 RepID=UPI002BF9A1EC|nr:helix-turn-helix transcriptional regulator [Sphingomonas sp.]HTG39411.1 helix-turn-helix transcriptional regulator [Sphingomonas sp.]